MGMADAPKSNGEEKVSILGIGGRKVAQIKFPNANDLTKFNVIVTPDTGFWKGATYHFTFTIPAMYPHEPPKVHCDTKIFHPNINLEGKSASTSCARTGTRSSTSTPSSTG